MRSRESARKCTWTAKLSGSRVQGHQRATQQRRKAYRKWETAKQSKSRAKNMEVIAAVRSKSKRPPMLLAGGFALPLQIAAWGKPFAHPMWPVRARANSSGRGEHARALVAGAYLCPLHICLP